MESVVIRDLKPGDRPAFIAVMAQAFAGDPLFVTAFGAADSTSQRPRETFLSFMFDMNRIMGGAPRGLLVGETLAACALLEPPARGALVHTGRLLASALRFAPAACRVPARTSDFLNRYTKLTRAASPAQAHDYLAMIGVHPERQGLGLGRRLVDDAIAQADRRPGSTGLALDTENPTNVALYARWGFRLSASIDIDGVTAHCIFRPNGEG